MSRRILFNHAQLFLFSYPLHTAATPRAGTTRPTGRLCPFRGRIQLWSCCFFPKAPVHFLAIGTPVILGTTLFHHLRRFIDLNPTCYNQLKFASNWITGTNKLSLPYRCIDLISIESRRALFRHHLWSLYTDIELALQIQKQRDLHLR